MKSITILLITLIFINGCSEEKRPKDGLYDAYVEYRNSDTDYEAKYALEVEIKNHVVSKISLPNGGYLDKKDFSMQLTNENDEIELYLIKNELYVITLIKEASHVKIKINEKNK